MKALVGTKFKYWSQVFFQLLLTAVVIIVCFTTTVGKYWRPAAAVSLGLIIGLNFRSLYVLRKLLLELQKHEKI